ncbi:hypothetical protein FRX31_023792 [Thalictrum thalictroides]|uniref:Uncharacterized protein n=1 Tax=Thalictrum thalictroides TaxID=46969 RepID=A0A7J6VNE9_THATH|nr:hypothetical protein FRX31_023792 [Thalictrum thalictroides]
MTILGIGLVIEIYTFTYSAMTIAVIVHGQHAGLTHSQPSLHVILRQQLQVSITSSSDLLPSSLVIFGKKDKILTCALLPMVGSSHRLSYFSVTKAGNKCSCMTFCLRFC